MRGKEKEKTKVKEEDNTEGARVGLPKVNNATHIIVLVDNCFSRQGNTIHLISLVFNKIFHAI